MAKTPQEIVESYGKTVDISFTYGTSTDEIGSVNSDKINEVRYYFDGALYTSVMRCMELKLIGNYTENIKKDYIVRAMNITVNSPDGEYFNISLNDFHVAEEPEYDAAQNLTSFILYDNMYLAMKPYDMSLDWTNGITLKNYLTAILGKLNIQYNATSLNLMANSDKLITSEKFIDIENDETESAYTYRDVLDEIAKAAGVSFCFKNSITGSGINSAQLYAVKPTESGIVIDESNLKSVTIGAEYGPVKGVVLSREPQEDNIYYPKSLTENDTAVKISNVEIMEDADDDTYRQNFIQGIYNNVIGTQYYLYDLDSFGILLLNFGDIFTIKACDRKDGEVGEEKSYKTILMRTDITVGDGISEKSKLEAPQATSTDYSAASTTDKTLKKTMLKVDKQNQKITGYIKDADGKYSLLVQTVEGIDLKIEDPKEGLRAQLTATATEAKSQYEALEKKVEKDFVSNAAYNSYIEQTAKEIKLNTDSIKEIQDAGYITETEARSMIDLQDEKITLSVEKNLKIGARNILLDSARFESLSVIGRSSAIDPITLYDDTSVPSGVFKDIVFTPYRDGNLNSNGTCSNSRGFYFTSASLLGQIYRKAEYTLTSDTEVEEYKRYYTRSGSDGSYVYSYVENPIKDDLATYYELTQEPQSIDKLKPNTTYALSWWMRWGYSIPKPEDFKFNDVFYFGDGNNAKYITDKCIFPGFDPSWQRYVIVFTTPAKITNFWLRFFFGKTSPDIGYSVHISSLKLEEGNIATDWTPSAEDIDQSVKAQIDLCVKTDENGKLVSEILIESNKLKINTDKFTLSGDGTVTCNDLTCSKIDEETGEDSGFSMKITQAEIKHVFAGKQIGRIGTSLDWSGTYYESIYGGEDCGVALKSNNSSGYCLYVYDSGAQIQKSVEHPGLLINESNGFALSIPTTQSSKLFNINLTTEWECNGFSTDVRMLLYCDSALVISTNEPLDDGTVATRGIYLDGNVVFCNKIFWDAKYNSGSGKAALYVDLLTGEITT